MGNVCGVRGRDENEKAELTEGGHVLVDKVSVCHYLIENGWLSKISSVSTLVEVVPVRTCRTTSSSRQGWSGSTHPVT
jgi:hypothetical protein